MYFSLAVGRQCKYPFYWSVRTNSQMTWHDSLDSCMRHIKSTNKKKSKKHVKVFKNDSIGAKMSKCCQHLNDKRRGLFVVCSVCVCGWCFWSNNNNRNEAEKKFERWFESESHIQLNDFMVLKMKRTTSCVCAWRAPIRIFGFNLHANIIEMSKNNDNEIVKWQ